MDAKDGDESKGGGRLSGSSGRRARSKSQLDQNPITATVDIETYSSQLEGWKPAKESNANELAQTVPGANAAEVPTSKPKTKAERRALQEAQRAKKAAAQGLKAQPPARKQTKKKKDDAKPKPVTVENKQLDFFSHLDQYQKVDSAKIQGTVEKSLHPAILRLGLRYASGELTGSNARAVALLHALKDVIQDYETPKQKTLARDLELSIRPLIDFLKDCRPLSISMGNAINYLKFHITRTADMTEDEAKSYLCGQIDRFLELRINAADVQIARRGAAKIRDGDVILTYARSHVVELLLQEAYKEGKKFRVVVTDSQPKLEGKRMLSRLISYGIDCTYILVSGVSYMMKEVTKVFLGAAALLANGAAVSRVGTAGVAMMASYSNVPVLVCCETYKFCDRAQLDAICMNELGLAKEILPPAEDSRSAVSDANSTSEQKKKKEVYTKLCAHEQSPNLNLLNVMYDLTPMQFVTAVITDVGMIPPTSVPVVLREYNRDLPMSV